MENIRGFHHPCDPNPENWSSGRLSFWPSRGSLTPERRPCRCPRRDAARRRFSGSSGKWRRGRPPSPGCRKHGVSQQTLYLWKKKYAGLGLSELRELRELREENAKLKRLVADLSLDRHSLQEIVGKKL